MINTEMKFVVTLIFTLIVIDITNGTVIRNETVKLLDAIEGAGDCFGMTVNVYGDRVIVGSPIDDMDGIRDPGSINIYSLNGSVVTLKTKLTTRRAGAYFGNSVAQNKHYIIVGSPGDDRPIAKQGAAYIYNYNGTAWVYKKVVADDGANGDYFGMSVGISESNEAVIGASKDGDKGLYSGSAYIFKYNGKQWKQIQKLLPEGVTTRDEFGHSIAMTNSHIAVGAPYQNNNNVTRSGGLYIYKKDTTWQLQTKLTSPNPEAEGRFGVSVSMYGARVVTGARFEYANKRGRAYVYVTDGNTWTLEATLTASDGKHQEDFGYAVSMYNQTIVVGAYRYRFETGVGTAYVFQRFDGKWKEINRLVASDEKFGWLGWAVSIYNGKVVVGKRLYYPKGKKVSFNSGAAYVFTNLNFTMATKPKTTPQAITTTAKPVTCRAGGRAGSRVHYILWFVVVFCFFCTTF